MITHVFDLLILLQKESSFEYINLLFVYLES